MIPLYYVILQDLALDV